MTTKSKTYRSLPNDDENRRTKWITLEGSSEKKSAAKKTSAKSAAMKRNEYAKSTRTTELKAPGSKLREQTEKTEYTKKSIESEEKRGVETRSSAKTSRKTPQIVIPEKQPLRSERDEDDLDRDLKSYESFDDTDDKDDWDYEAEEKLAEVEAENSQKENAEDETRSDDDNEEVDDMAKTKSKAQAKKPKQTLKSKLKNSKSMAVYTDHAYKKRAKKEAKARREAEDLAELPKEPVKRFFAKLHPKRVARFVFSKKGLFLFLKIVAAVVLIGVVTVGGLFLYYKKDLESIRLSDLTVSETVNTYLDRNGNVLWEDKGDGDYRLVVEGDQISTYMRQATVAIEDKNFYNHPGIDPTALVRATVSTLTGHGVQGGSTLTQQLIKQIYFSDEAGDRTVTGIPRKIKEMILAIELEQMYSKEQIITMYLNESPYGGRRNGVESAAQTYFNKSAKDLTLAESAFLAAIPNNPAVLNPYNEYGNDALIARQQKTLDVMVEMGYITKDEAEAAKKENILDTVQPESDQYDNIKAPHFVLEVKKQLEEKYGVKTMRAGGYTITTTVDIRAQEMAEAAVADGAQYLYMNGSDNIAMASVDVETGQVIAEVGSLDWNKDVYGEVNAATSLLEPGSSIKPILDYTPLFMQRTGTNYGPGSILKDENIDKIYCGGYQGTCMLRNASNKFNGNISIRNSLGNSLNIPAVKALIITGTENALEVAHNLGDWSYCEGRDPATYGYSIAIGSGCNVRLDEHANAYASLARGGVYKPLSYVLELKNSSGDIIEKWEDTEGKRVVDAQVAYEISDILSDASARGITFGGQARSFGFVVPGVWTASKTGTTTTTNADVTKDSLMASYSTAVATVVWNGNHDGSGLKGTNYIVRKVIGNYMENVHKNLYASEGKWSSGDKPSKPAGIQTLSVNGVTDIWPSWYNKNNNGLSKTTVKFNAYTKKLASDCTPASMIEELEVSYQEDPVSKNKVYFNLPEGYSTDEENKDDCTYTLPTVKITGSSFNDGKLELTFSAVKGTANLNQYIVYVDGIQTLSATVAETQTITLTSDANGNDLEVGAEIKVQVSDVNGGSSADSTTLR